MNTVPTVLSTTTGGSEGQQTSQGWMEVGGRGDNEQGKVRGRTSKGHWLLNMHSLRLWLFLLRRKGLGEGEMDENIWGFKKKTHVKQEPK